MTDYCAVTDIQQRMNNQNVDFGQVSSIIGLVSRAIEVHCGRRFDADTVATQRVYDSPGGYIALRVDDISTTDGLAIHLDTNHDGVYETAVLGTEFVLQPLNQVVDGAENYPYTVIAPIPPRFWPISYPYVTNGRAFIQVTAKWGWPAIPSAIKSVCIEATARRLFGPLAPLRGESVGTYSVTYEPNASELLTDYDKEQLDRFSKRLGI